MFSFPKLVVLGLIILAVIYGFKLAGSLKERQAKRESAPEPAAEKRRARERERERLEVEDLVQCPKCGAYVASGGDHECRRRA